MHHTTEPPTRPTTDSRSPQCRIGEHDACAGNANIYLPGADETEPPIERLRCSCSCDHPAVPARFPSAVRP